jgi:hypothetical protein
MANTRPLFAKNSECAMRCYVSFSSMIINEFKIKS